MRATMQGVAGEGEATPAGHFAATGAESAHAQGWPSLSARRHRGAALARAGHAAADAVGAFAAGWDSGFLLEENKPRLPRRQIRHILESYSDVRPARHERELQLLLTGYLKAQVHNAIIDFEAMMVDSRIDLLIGPKPHHERTGVEIKFRPNDGDINRIVGQMRKYRTNHADLFLVVGSAEFSSSGRHQLVSELREINVHLIDVT